MREKTPPFAVAVAVVEVAVVVVVVVDEAVGRGVRCWWFEKVENEGEAV